MEFQFKLAHTRKRAHTLNHKIIIASNTLSSKGKVINRYTSFENTEELETNYSKLTYGFELLEEHRPCVPYFDLEWIINDIPPTDILYKFVDYFHEVMDRFYPQGGQFTYEDILVSSACGIDSTGTWQNVQKASFHIKIDTLKRFKNVLELREIIQYMKFDIYQNKEKYPEFFYIKDEQEKLIMDDCPYMRNQTFRMLYQYKYGKNRPLIPIRINNFRFSDDPIQHLVGYYEEASERSEECQEEDFYNIEAIKEINNMNKPCKSYKKSNKGDFKSIYTPSSSSLSVENCESCLIIRPDYSTPKEYEETVNFYLSCINNRGAGRQPWNVWWTVGTALKNSGMSLELWIDWSSQFAGYIDGECEDYWQRFVASQERGANIYTLRRWAKMIHPELFNNSIQDRMKYFFDTYEESKLEGISREIYHERYIRPFTNNRNCLCIKSAMGTGKTSRIKDYIIENNVRRVIILSPRQIFAQNLTNDLNILFPNTCDKFKSYLNISTPKELCNTDRLIIQMESLFKLNYNFKPYDLLIMDESESNLKQFSSRETMKMITGCVDIFEQLLMTSGRIICADAFLTQRTIDCIKNFIPPQQIHIIENTFIPDPREAIEINNFIDFKLQMIDSLDKGKKIVGIFASSTKAQEFYYEMINYFANKGESLPKNKFYYAKQSDSINNLKNITEEWSNIQLLIYSPLITVGVNFDPAIIHFDEIFIYGSAMSCTVRDIFQSSMRVRKLNDNKLYFNINSEYVVVKPDTLWGTKLDIMNREKHIEIFDLMNYKVPIDDEECPSWLYTNNVFNEFEENFHRMNYKPVFYSFLEKCGYTILNNSLTNQDIEADNEDLQLYEIIDTNDIVEQYKNISNITKEQFKIIKQKIERKIATKDEKLQYEKYRFTRSFKYDTNEDLLIMIWNQFYNVSQVNKKYFFNIKDEKRYTPQEVREREQYKKLALVRAVQMENILNIIQILELKSSQDVETIITYNKILELREIIIPQIEELNDLFEFRDYKKNENNKQNESDFRTTVIFLKKIFKFWSGCNLEMDEKTKNKKITLNGKRINTPSYKLCHELPFYNHILDRNEKWQKVPQESSECLF
jgi:hypothetical protein